MTLSAAVKELDRKTSNHTDAVQRFNIANSVVAAPQQNSKAIGYHHLERLAPAQLQRMHHRLQQTLQRAGEALHFDEVCFLCMCTKHACTRDVWLSLYYG